MSIAVFALAFAGVEAKSNEVFTAPTGVVSTVKGVNSFCKAIMQGDIETVKSLLALGEDVNQKSLGMTPAIFAARYNQAEILELLLEKGADLSIKCDKGRTAKEYAELSNAKDALLVIEKKLG